MLFSLLCLAPSPVNAQAPQPVGIAVGGDNLTRLVWNNPDITISLWKIAADGTVASQNSYGPYYGWSASAISMGPDSFARVLCTHPADGQMALWRVDPSTAALASTSYGPYSGWNSHCLTVGGDNAPRLLWNHSPDGVASLWKIAADGTLTAPNYGPDTGYIASLVAAGPNSIPRTLWNKSDGSISLWYSTSDLANYAHTEYGPFAGYSPVALAVDSTNAPRIVWNHPSDDTISLWKVAADGTYTYQNYTDPTGFVPVALAAGTGADVRLLWSNGQGGAVVWTIAAGGTYTSKAYPIVDTSYYSQVSYITVTPNTITAGNSAEMAIHLSNNSSSGMTVNLSSNSNLVHVPSSIQTPPNSSALYMSISAIAGTYDYTQVKIYATAVQNPAVTATTTVTLYTPGGIVTGGGGTGGGGGGTGGGGGGTGGGGGGTGGGGTGGGGMGTGTGSGPSYGQYTVTYSGGTIVTQDASGTHTVYPVSSSYGYNASASIQNPSATALSASMQGPLIAHFHWVADTAHPGSPPPAQAIVTQTCSFSWQLYNSTSVSGFLNTDLGQSGPIPANTNSVSVSPNGGSKTFTVNTRGLPNFDASCNPTASFSGSSNAQVSLGYVFTAAAIAPNVNVTLQAHSTKDTTGWDATQPRFFSGTNCSAIASAAAASGSITHAQLLVGTTVVKDYYDTAFAGHPAAGPNVTLGTNLSTATLSVNFDSTHFADTSAVPIQMVVTDSGGKTFPATIQVTAYNKGYVGYEAAGGVDAGQATAAVVDSEMTGTNITKTDSLPTQYRAPVIAAITANTVFFTYNHGNETPDSTNGPNFESPAGVGNTNELIYPNRASDPSGNGTPPRDDVAEAVANKGVNAPVPPYNFVFLDICNGAYTPSFANGFGIPTSGTSGVPAAGATDRAFLGWNGVVEDGDVNTQWTKILYHNLLSGKTLRFSLDAADKLPGGPPQENNPQSPRYHQDCQYFIHGDEQTTVHASVYQGTTWFK